MSHTTLIELFPRNADGAEVPLRFVHNARQWARFLALEWRPGIISLPDFELDLGFDGKMFGQRATPQVGQLVLATDRAESWHSLIWPGATGNLRTAAWPAGSADAADGAFGVPQLFRVTDFSIGEGEARLTLIDIGDPLRRPAVVRKFGATGNALLDGAGVVDRRGQPVPTGWGRLRNVPGVLVDRVNNIWLFLDRPSASVQAFYDGGAGFAAGVARSSLSLLQANAPAAGAVDYCLDAGGLTLARPWAQPTYPFTADLMAAGPPTAAGVAQALVTARTPIALQAGTVAAFDALYPAVCGLYIDDERTIGTALDELLVRLGGWWRLTLANELAFGRLAPAAPMMTFGRTDVISIARQAVVMPTRRRTVGYGRNNRVHREGEIASILLVDDIVGLGALARQDAVDFGSQVTGPGKPETNADVTATAVPSLSVPAGIVVKCDSTGSPLAGQLPRQLGFRRRRGDIDVSATTSWALVETGCTATIDGNGTVTVTASAADGKVRVTADRDWVRLAGETAVIRELSPPAAPAPPPPPPPGSPPPPPPPIVGLAVSATVSSGSYGAPVGSAFVVRTGSAGRLVLSFSGEFWIESHAPIGTFGMAAKAQWRAIGGNFADAGAEEAQSNLAAVGFEGEFRTDVFTSGALSLSRAVTGLLANTDYEVRLLARNANGTGAATWSRGLAGIFSAAAS